MTDEERNFAASELLDLSPDAWREKYMPGDADPAAAFAVAEPAPAFDRREAAPLVWPAVAATPETWSDPDFIGTLLEQADANAVAVAAAAGLPSALPPAVDNTSILPMPHAHLPRRMWLEHWSTAENRCPKIRHTMPLAKLWQAVDTHPESELVQIFLGEVDQYSFVPTTRFLFRDRAARA